MYISTNQQDKINSNSFNLLIESMNEPTSHKIKKVSIKILNHSFTIFCLFSLFYQLYSISQMYFKYRTAEQIKIQMPRIYKPQALSLCIHYDDLFSSDINLTIVNHKFIYQNSLSVDKSVIRSEFRLPQSYELFDCSYESCSNIYNYTKFTYGPFICYKFAIKSNNEIIHVNQTDINGNKILVEKKYTSMTYDSLSVTPAGSGMIFKLWISPTLNTASMFKIATHSVNLYPINSFPTVKLITRNLTKKTKGKIFSSYYSSQKRLYINRLRRPYETDCFDYSLRGFSGRAHCVQVCHNLTVTNTTGKLPFSVLYDKPIDLPLITYGELIANSTLKNILKSSRKHCEEVVCRQLSCLSRTAFTLTVEQDSDQFEIEFLVTHSPTVTITSYGILNLVEYITYMMGTISTWVGLTAAHLNPILIIIIFTSSLNTCKEHLNKFSSELKSIENMKNNINYDDYKSDHKFTYGLTDCKVNNNIINLTQEKMIQMSKEEKKLLQSLNVLNNRIKKLESCF